MGILRLRCGLGRRVPEVAAVLAAAVGSSRSALRNLGVRGILEVERLALEIARGALPLQRREPSIT